MDWDGLSMSRYPQGRFLPTMALCAFESAARHGNFSSAAIDLNISQPSVSRYIALLEQRLSSRLFERNRAGVSLTEAGEAFYRSVVKSLDHLELGANLLTNRFQDSELVLACGHTVSRLFLMPRFDTLQKALGNIRIRVLTCDYDMMSQLRPSDADVVFDYNGADSAPEDRVAIFKEAVAVVCSPVYAAAHADILNRPVAEWGELLFLSFAEPSQGRATWDDWFDVAGRPEPAPRYQNYFDILYLLEAALAGSGAALFNRNLIDRRIEAGELVTVGDDTIEFDRYVYARLTKRGRQHPLARQCLDFFASLSE